MRSRWVGRVVTDSIMDRVSSGPAYPIVFCLPHNAHIDSHGIIIQLVMM